MKMCLSRTLAKSMRGGVTLTLSDCASLCKSNFFRSKNQSEIPYITTDFNDCEHSWDYPNQAVMQNEVRILPVALCGEAVEVSKGSTRPQVPACAEQIGRFAGAHAIHRRLPSTPFAKLTASARTEPGFLMCSFEECYSSHIKQDDKSQRAPMVCWVMLLFPSNSVAERKGACSTWQRFSEVQHVFSAWSWGAVQHRLGACWSPSFML